VQRDRHINLIFRPRRSTLTAISYRHAQAEAFNLWANHTAEMVTSIANYEPLKSCSQQLGDATAIPDHLNGGSFPRRRSSTFRSESGNRTYITTAKRMISGLVLNYRKGERFVILLS
jgi:hypothetical protein